MTIFSESSWERRTAIAAAARSRPVMSAFASSTSC
jgi:hypothetical protein